MRWANSNVFRSNVRIHDEHTVLFIRLRTAMKVLEKIPKKKKIRRESKKKKKITSYKKNGCDENSFRLKMFMKKNERKRMNRPKITK